MKILDFTHHKGVEIGNGQPLFFDQGFHLSDRLIREMVGPGMGAVAHDFHPVVSGPGYGFYRIREPIFSECIGAE